MSLQRFMAGFIAAALSFTAYSSCLDYTPTKDEVVEYRDAAQRDLNRKESSLKKYEELVARTSRVSHSSKVLTGLSLLPATIYGSSALVASATYGATYISIATSSEVLALAFSLTAHLGPTLASGSFTIGSMVSALRDSGVEEERIDELVEIYAESTADRFVCSYYEASAAIAEARELVMDEHFSGSILGNFLGSSEHEGAQKLYALSLLEVELARAKLKELNRI